MQVKRDLYSDTTAFFQRTVDFDTSIHESLEIIYSTSGTATAFVDGKKYDIGPGCCLLVFPNQIHSYHDSIGEDRKAFFTAVIHPKNLLQYSDTVYSFHPLNPLLIPDDNSLVYLLRAAEHEFLFGRKNTLDLLVTAILTKLIPMVEMQRRDVPSDLISRTLIYCNEHYKEPITAEQTADDNKISKKHLSNLFNKSLNIGFNDYINSLRISEAVRLIADNDASITNVAYAVGFSSISTFNRAFKNIYGVTPSEYKKQYHKFNKKKK